MTRRRVSRLLANQLTIAMCAEAVSWPSPGLVSVVDSGSHSDMDVFTLLESSVLLAPFFEDAAEVGFDAANGAASHDAVFPRLRELGLRAEREMLDWTGGVNSHRGTIFMGLLLVAALSQELEHGRAWDVDSVCLRARDWSREHLQADLDSVRACAPHSLTIGLRAWRDFGLPGARGEVLTGFSNVRAVGLPTIKRQMPLVGINGALVQALLELMAVVDDTTLLNRSFDMSRLRQVKEWASNALELGGVHSEAGWQALCHMHERCARAGMSPGGSADQVIISYWFYRCHQDFAQSCAPQGML